MAILRRFLYKIFIVFFSMVISATVGTLLLILVYYVPTETISKNVRTGIETLLVEGPTFNMPMIINQLS